MKKLTGMFLLILSAATAFAQVLNDAQFLKTGHWAYDSLAILSSEAKRTNFAEVTPLSVGELKFYLEELDYESLSDSGRAVYDELAEFLYADSDFIRRHTRYDISPARFDMRLTVTPEFYYKSNPGLDWTFRYYYADNVLSLPLLVGFSDYVACESDFFLGRNYSSMADPYNFTNILYDGGQYEFHWPTYAYGGAAVNFEKWGANFHIGREGLSIGRTHTGSVIYNSTFETEAYAQLNIYTRVIRLSMDAVQIDANKFMYLHQLDVRLFKVFKIVALEGVLINGPFEFRYLNPFMINHSMAFWRDYRNETEFEYYNEGYASDYLGVIFEYTPVRNLNIYFEYAMNELQLPNELAAGYTYYPDSQAFMLGLDVTIPARTGGHWLTSLEGVYLSPWCYYKQAPGWSLYRERSENSGGGTVYSWIGSPFGPDSFAVQYRLAYRHLNKWSVEFDCLFNINGEHDFSLFSDENTTDIDGTKIYTYYPYTRYKLAEDEDGREDAVEDARRFWMSGTLEYRQQVALKGSYQFTQRISAQAQVTYTFVFNNNHILDNFEQGVELAVSASCTLF